METFKDRRGILQTGDLHKVLSSSTMKFIDPHLWCTRSPGVSVTLEILKNQYLQRLSSNDLDASTSIKSKDALLIFREQDISAITFFSQSSLKLKN